MGLGLPTKAVFNYSSSVPAQKGTQEQSYSFEYNHLKKEEIVDLARKIFPALKVSVNDVRNKVFVFGKKADIRRFKVFVESIDKNAPSVYYKTWLIEVNHNSLMGLGINWQQYKNGLKVSNLTDKQKLFDSISGLVSKGEAKVLANPTIICLDEEMSTIRVGDRIPYTVPVDTASDKISWELRYIDAGVDLSIRPSIQGDGVILSNIKVKIESIKQWKSTMAGEYPVLSSREMNLKCKIKDGEELVLGGLINSSKRKNVASLPILGSIPFIDHFFNQTTIEEEDTEIIFLLSPEIVSI